MSKKREKIKEEFIRHLRDVYNLCLYLTRNGQEAEDLTQDTFLRALEYIDSYTPNTNAKAFLFKIATSIFYNKISRINSEHNIEYRSFSEDDGSEVVGRDLTLVEDEEDRFIKEYTSAEIRRLLLNLSFEHRTILVLADMEEFSYEEISKILNIPIGTVMSRLNRARSALKKEIFRMNETIEKESNGLNAHKSRNNVEYLKH